MDDLIEDLLFDLRDLEHHQQFEVDERKFLVLTDNKNSLEDLKPP